MSPQPWQRTGPGKATDGGLKFDLTQFDQAYFDRLRARTQALNNAGIYAGIYLFTGEFLNLFRCSSDGYPFTGANNINGIDDGYMSGPKGMASMTMTAPNAITRFQDAYVEKVIDTLNDLPNVLWIVSEEAPNDTQWWNNYQIAHIRKYEARKAAPAPDRVGRRFCPTTAATDAILYNSDADWVAPNSTISPNQLLRKRHAGLQSERQRQRSFLLRSSMEGHPAAESQLRLEELRQRQPGAVHGPLPAVLPAREHRNLCVSPTKGVCAAPDTRWDNLQR